MIVIGRPGLQKSRLIRDALGSKACWIDGHATPFAIYCELYKHLDAPVVIDDVDNLHADRSGVRLLKSLCQTEQCKKVAWHSKAPTLDREQIPTEFVTKSRVVIIANEWTTLNANVAAIEDRGHVVVFEPTAIEVHLRSASWFWDQEVFDFIAHRLNLIAEPSMRCYIKGWELKQAGLNWHRYLLESWGLTKARLLAAQLKSDISYAIEEDRVRAFIEMGGGCRATYFNHTKKLPSATDVPQIKLTCSPPRDSSLDVFDLMHLRHGQLGSG